MLRIRGGAEVVAGAIAGLVARCIVRRTRRRQLAISDTYG